MQGHYGKETFPPINLLLNPFSVIPFLIIRTLVCSGLVHCAGVLSRGFVTTQFRHELIQM